MTMCYESRASFHAFGYDMDHHLSYPTRQLPFLIALGGSYWRLLWVNDRLGGVGGNTPAITTIGIRAKLGLMSGISSAKFDMVKFDGFGNFSLW
uniref:Uncharacterized protein n=1 Tax=Vitis vinifera TaxID=29760 RepID=F6HZJ1_VITVI